MKKKIILFSTIAGGGQKSVTDALQFYLNDDYDVHCVGTFSQVLTALDPIYVISLGYTSGETIYNYLVQKQHNTLTNTVLYTGACWYFRLLQRIIQTLLQRYIAKEKPEAIISVIPFINNALIQAAQKNNIPFVLFPPDFDIRMYLHLIKNPSYKKFYVALPLETKEINEMLEKNGIGTKHCVTTGYPLRPAFDKPYNIKQIKNAFHVPFDKPVILILLGSLGSEKLPLLAQQLIRVKQPVHYIFCTGKSIQQKKILGQTAFPEHITTTIIGFTREIDKLMAISDIFITKSGSVSVAEGLYMNLPLLLDATTDVLAWEQYNHVLVEKYQIGKSIPSYKQAPQIIDALLAHPEQLQQYKENSKKLSIKNGGTAFKHLIDKLTAAR